MDSSGGHGQQFKQLSAERLCERSSCETLSFPSLCLGDRQHGAGRGHDAGRRLSENLCEARRQPGLCSAGKIGTMMSEVKKIEQGLKSPDTIWNALTVDVEDYFMVSAFAAGIKFEDWPRYECRVERNTHRILELFAKNG